MKRETLKFKYNLYHLYETKHAWIKLNEKRYVYK